MNSIKLSVWFLLTQSKLFLGVLIGFAAFTIAIILIKSTSKFQSLSLIFQLFLFMGVALGGSVAKLKRNYLWKINSHYKNSILHGYLLIILCVGLSFLPFLWTFTIISPLILAMPICTSVYASHMVLGKNLLYKFMIPAIPLGIFQLTKLGFGINTVLLLIVLATMVLILLMYKNFFYQYSDHQITDQQDKANTVAFMTTGLSHKHMSKLNGLIGIVVSKWVMHGKKNLDWSVLMPHTRLTLMTLFYSLFLFVFMTITDPNVQKMHGKFALMILPNMFLGLVMESRNLLNQTKFFAHVFTGDKHKQLKRKILFAMDKNFLINVIVFVAMTLLIINMLSINVPINPLLLSLAVVICISFAITPILMCLSWINLSLLLIIILVGYAGLLLALITWIYKNPLLVTTVPYVTVFVTSCLLLRVVAQYLFWQRPIEQLLKNK